MEKNLCHGNLCTLFTPVEEELYIFSFMHYFQTQIFLNESVIKIETHFSNSRTS